MKSPVWSYFRVMSRGGCTQTVCQICHKGFVRSTSGSTSSMLRHIKSRHPDFDLSDEQGLKKNIRKWSSDLQLCKEELRASNEKRKVTRVKLKKLRMYTVALQAEKTQKEEESKEYKQQLEEALADSEDRLRAKDQQTTAEKIKKEEEFKQLEDARLEKDKTIRELRATVAEHKRYGWKDCRKGQEKDGIIQTLKRQLSAFQTKHRELQDKEQEKDETIQTLMRRLSGLAPLEKAVQTYM